MPCSTTYQHTQFCNGSNTLWNVLAMSKYGVIQEKKEVVSYRHIRYDDNGNPVQNTLTGVITINNNGLIQEKVIITNPIQ